MNGDFTELQEEIRIVKSEVMEHLENTEEARIFVEEAMRTKETGDIIVLFIFYFTIC